MNKEPFSTFIPPVSSSDRGKLVVVLDLDETLVFARDGPVVPRPGAQELLATLKGLCEIVVWTAGERQYAQSVIHQIDVAGAVQHCIYRHQKWWDGQPGYTKNLQALGRPLERIVIVDNTPDCMRHFADHGILVSDFEGSLRFDNTMQALLRVLLDLSRAHSSVPAALASHPDLVKRRVKCDGPGYVFLHTLAQDNHLGAPVYQVGRVNRDLVRW